jgi:hypothetical protein
MDLEQQTSEAPTQPDPAFDGYPYLVTPLGPGLCHYIVLPGDLGIDELVHLARRQHAANRLRTCLVLGPATAVHLADEGETLGEVPWCNIPVSDGLMGPEEFPPTVDLRERQQRLRAFIAEGPASWTVIDSMPGRPATAEELVRLSGTDLDGVPVGLVRCTVCTAYRGECLGSTQQPYLVVRVFCRCENHNRCARCLHRLYEHRLDGCYYDEGERTVIHVPAFGGLSHRCPSRPAMAKDLPRDMVRPSPLRPALSSTTHEATRDDTRSRYLTETWTERREALMDARWNNIRRDLH